jgi:anti-anti-sigma factor
MSMQQHDVSAEQRRHVAAPARYGARGDPTVWCTCSTTSTSSSSSTGASIIVLRVAGELDLATVEFLITALTAVLHQRPDHLIVDLAELSFCDARGLAAIAEAGVTATNDGTSFSVSAASALMLRCWAQFWANEQPTQFPTSVAAVSAAWAHPALPTPQSITRALPPLDHAVGDDAADHLATTVLVAAPAA